jgi:hypothetical protein
MPPSKVSERLTPLETENMNVLWEVGPATALTANRRLRRELAYTTVQRIGRESGDELSRVASIDAGKTGAAPANAQGQGGA